MRLITLVSLLISIKVLSAKLEFKKNGESLRSITLVEMQKGNLLNIFSQEIKIYNAW